MNYTYVTNVENITVDQHIEYDKSYRAYILYADVVKREERGGYIVSTHSPADGIRHIVQQLAPGERRSKKALKAAEEVAEKWTYPQALRVAEKNGIKIVGRMN